MAAATLKCSEPSLLARPAGKGCPRKRGRGGVCKEKREERKEVRWRRKDGERNKGKGWTKKKKGEAAR